MKILNLYAGIGGNRKLWSDEHEIIAVEFDHNIAEVYRQLYPSDTVIEGDAHDFLLNHFKEFDFIWTSPPCQTHSSFRQNICVRYHGTAPAYPDMKLYQEIIFLQYNAECKWVVENVVPYYEPLIKPSHRLQRHLFWSNFSITEKEFEKDNIRSSQIPDLEKLHGFNLEGFRLPNKRQVLRNCVKPDLGKYILDEAMKGQQ